MSTKRTRCCASGHRRSDGTPWRCKRAAEAGENFCRRHAWVLKAAHEMNTAALEAEKASRTAVEEEED